MEYTELRLSSVFIDKNNRSRECFANSSAILVFQRPHYKIVTNEPRITRRTRIWDSRTKQLIGFFSNDKMTEIMKLNRSCFLNHEITGNWISIIRVLSENPYYRVEQKVEIGKNEDVGFRICKVHKLSDDRILVISFNSELAHRIFTLKEEENVNPEDDSTNQKGWKFEQTGELKKSIIDRNYLPIFLSNSKVYDDCFYLINTSHHHGIHLSSCEKNEVLKTVYIEESERLRNQYINKELSLSHRSRSLYNNPMPIQNYTTESGDEIVIIAEDINVGIFNFGDGKRMNYETAKLIKKISFCKSICGIGMIETKHHLYCSITESNDGDHMILDCSQKGVETDFPMFLIKDDFYVFQSYNISYFCDEDNPMVIMTPHCGNQSSVKPFRLDVFQFFHLPKNSQKEHQQSQKIGKEEETEGEEDPFADWGGSGQKKEEQQEQQEEQEEEGTTEKLKRRKRHDEFIERKFLKDKVKGTLRINVTKCEDLKIADPNGFSDPYCILRLLDNDIYGTIPPELRTKKGQKGVLKTKIVKKNLNPIFNFSCGLQVSDCRKQYLRIDILDWDRVGKDDSLGYVIFPLRWLRCGEWMPDYSLNVIDGKGKIQFKCKAVGFGYDDYFHNTMCREKTRLFVQD